MMASAWIRKSKSRLETFKAGLKQAALKLVFTNENKRAVMELLRHRIERGATESGAINGLREIYAKEYGEYNPRTMILAEVAKRFMSESDASLLGALEGLCGPEVKPILASGRKSGRVIDTLKLATDYYKNAAAIRSAVMSALAGPILSVIVMVIIIFIFSVKVFPALASAMSGSGDMSPALARMVAFSDFVVNDGIFILVSVAALVVYAMWSLPNQLRWRDTLDRFPPWSIYRSAQSASFLVTLASLLQAKMTTKQALDIVGANSSVYVASWVRKISKSLVMGHTEGAALSTDFFVREARVELRSYVDSPDFIEKLPSIADDVRAASLKSVVSASKVITMLIMLMIAIYAAMSMMALVSIEFRPSN